MPASVGALLRTAYRSFPSVFEGVALRTDRYNAGRRFLFELEERGQAYVFAPDNLWINNTESRRERLEATYRAGLVQAVREMPAIKAFLGL
jgi:putative phospholipase